MRNMVGRLLGLSQLYWLVSLAGTIFLVLAVMLLPERLENIKQKYVCEGCLLGGERIDLSLIALKLDKQISYTDNAFSVKQTHSDGMYGNTFIQRSDPPFEALTYANFHRDQHDAVAAAGSGVFLFNDWFLVFCLVVLWVTFVMFGYVRLVSPLIEKINILYKDIPQTSFRSGETPPGLIVLDEMKKLIALETSIQDARVRHTSVKKILLRELITDPLTQVLNRRGFKVVSKKVLGALSRRKAYASIIIMDVDHFKDVNDTYGHVMGDFVLATLAQHIQSINREGDVFARYGGEEFILLSSSGDIQSALLHAERIRKSVADLEISTDATHVIKITMSLGVASFRADFEELDHAIRRADKMLYQAKGNGRNSAFGDIDLLA